MPELAERTTVGGANRAMESATWSHFVLFAALASTITAVFGKALLDLFILARSHSEYTHTALIGPISLLLLALSRNEIFSTVEWQAVNAAPLACLGALLAASAATAPAYSLSLSVAAIVVLLISTFLLCFGKTTFRGAKFPLLFLFLMVPPPESVVNTIVAILQRGSAEAAYLLLRWAMIPVAKDGVLLYLPNFNLQVAAECSSIRSSMLLLVVTLVLAHRFLHASWKKILIILMVLPIAILKNGIRIFTLGALGTYLDPAILSSWIHHSGGFLFFGVGVGMVMLLIHLLGRVGSDGSLSHHHLPHTRAACRFHNQ